MDGHNTETNLKDYWSTQTADPTDKCTKHQSTQ